MFGTIVILLISAIYLWVKHIYSHWERKGFPFMKPSIPMGNLDAVRKGERSFGMAIYDLYVDSKENFVGIYLIFRPGLLIRDVALIKTILTKDFSKFHDRGIYVDEKDPISANLFALKGRSWKSLRTKLTPTFSSGKLKGMFDIIHETGVKLQNHLATLVGDEDFTTIEMKNMMLNYSTNIIGSVIFGLEVDSFNDPENEFRAVHSLINKRGIIQTIRLVATFLCPQLISLLHLSRLPNEVGDFMINLVKKTIELREKTNYSRKDLMQLLIQLRNTGKVNLDDSVWKVETVAENLKSMSIEQCAAQAFVFYIAGNETSASATAFCLYELAQNPQVLVKVEKEIEEVLTNYNGVLTYDAIQEMKYLDLCIMETTRKYPGLPILNRECTENYLIPDTDYTIEKGTPIIISLMGIHRDPKYFPDPLKFDPDRFLEGNSNFNSDAFIPFGDGPRQCIGIRLGKMSVKVGIVMILQKFNLIAMEKKEIEFDNYSVGIMPKGGINIKISKKQNS